MSVHTAGGNLVSRRWLSTDPDNVAFDVHRAGTATAPRPSTTTP